MKLNASTFVASSASTQLKVTSLSTDIKSGAWYPTAGDHLDDFSVSEGSAIPEPSMLVFLGVSFLVLFRFRKS